MDEIKSHFGLQSLREIDRGKFGVVFKGTKSDQNEVAVKVVKFRGNLKYDLEEFHVQIRREIDILKQVHHPHILNYIQDRIEPLQAIIVTECLDFSLRWAIKNTNHKPLPEKLTLQMAREIGSALVYLHNLRIVHHDVKPQNIMLVYSGSYLHKLIDFGLARPYPQASRDAWVQCHKLGTDYFMPHEMTNGKSWRDQTYNPYLADSYAFGATLAIACLGNQCMENVPKFMLPRTFELAFITNKPPNRLWQGIFDLLWPLDCDNRLFVDQFLDQIKPAEPKYRNTAKKRYRRLRPASRKRMSLPFRPSGR